MFNARGLKVQKFNDIGKKTFFVFTSVHACISLHAAASPKQEKINSSEATS
jgi:hypothetical protein